MRSDTKIQVWIFCEVSWWVMQTSGKQAENAFHIQECFLFCNKKIIWYCDSFNILASEEKQN